MGKVEKDRNKMTTPLPLGYDPDAVLKESFRNREAVMAAKFCGCYHCLFVFESSEITEWWDSDVCGMEQTAVCPKCGIDAVLPSKTNGYFLQKMQDYAFITKPTHFILPEKGKV